MIHRLVITKLNFSCRVRHASDPKLAQEQQEQLPVIINELRVWQDDRLVLAMEGGISISEGYQHPIHLRSERAKRVRIEAKDTGGTICSRTNGRSTVPAFDGATSPELVGAASSKGASETSHFRFCLSTSKFIERACRLFGRAELSAKVSPDLRHAQDGFGCDVAIVGQQRRDHVDGAGALIDRLSRFAIRLEATEHIFRSRRRRIIVDALGARGNGRHSQRAGNKSYRSGKHHCSCW